jgi:hypothetical protein
MNAPLCSFDGVEARLAEVCAACISHAQDPGDLDCSICILGGELEDESCDEEGPTP